MNDKFMSKGLWEKTLQTDMNLAKKALSEALSTGKPSINGSPSESSSSNKYDNNSGFTYGESSSEVNCTKTGSEVQVQLSWLESWLLDDTEEEEECVFDISVDEFL